MDEDKPEIDFVAEEKKTRRKAGRPKGSKSKDFEYKKRNVNERRQSPSSGKPVSFIGS